ncbi:MAG: radical SAM protein [bacterium]
MLEQIKPSFIKQSPEYLKMSLASALTLGLKQGKFYRNAKSHCLNLLLIYENGCIANCSYCGLSSKRIGNNKSFIRVDWPIYKLDEIIEKTKNCDDIKRICISMVTRKESISDIIKISYKIKEKISLPLSFLISPTIIEKKDLLEFKNVGVDKIGIALDCATEQIFEEIRGKNPHKWEKYWEIITQAQKIFRPEQIGIHLIVGLGETEKQMLDVIQKIHNNGSNTHLFSFFPEMGSKLENKKAPLISSYRRIQLGKFLIDENLIKAEQIFFNSKDEVLNFGLDEKFLEKVIQEGNPFLTSGCSGKNEKLVCNRPYANSLPDNIRNFPFLPDKEDIEKIKKEFL